MPLSVADRYKAHVENLRALDLACLHLHRQLKSALSRNEAQPASALLKTFVLLLGAWSEVRLLKMLHEPQAFTDAERQFVLSVPAKVEQWKTAIQVGFQRRYGVHTKPFAPAALPRTARHRYTDIVNLVEAEIRPIVEIRNRLAHGQWSRAFNNELTDISATAMALLNTENALSANFKKSIIATISSIVNDLLVGNTAFERDFDNHYRNLEHTKTNLRTRDYDDWERRLREKYARGAKARLSEEQA